MRPRHKAAENGSAHSLDVPVRFCFNEAAA